MRFVGAPERSVVRDEIEFGGRKEFQIIFMRPDDVDHGPRVGHVLHHDADGLSAFRAAIFGKILVVKEAHSRR